jgi:hypothetical protein
MICIGNSVLQLPWSYCRESLGACAMLRVRVLMVPWHRAERRHDQHPRRKRTTEVIRKEDRVIEPRWWNLAQAVVVL